MPEARAITVLNVDDNEARRYLVGRALRAAGYTVLEAASGAEGLELAGQLPNAMIVDVRLPDMTGFEMARRLKQDLRTARIPILHISAGYVEAQDRVRGLDLGADAYLTEPFETIELVATIRSLLRMRAAETALQESRERLELAQRAGGIGTFEYDLKTGVITWTKELEALYGLQPGSFAGNYDAWLRHVHPLDRKDANAALQEVIATGNELNTEFRVLWPDNSVRWLNARAQPLRDSSGAPARIIGVNMDVTQRRKAEESARESFQRLQQAHVAAKIGAYEWNLKTNRIHWSMPVPSLAQLARDQSFESWMELVHPDDRPEMEAGIQAMFRDRKDHEAECRVRRPDGGFAWLYWRGSVVGSKEAAHTHVVGIAMDITDRKLSEETLRRTDKLAATGRLAAAIAHEINNPMESLTNLLYLINESAGLDETGRNFAIQAQEELRRIAHITRQMLAFYRESTKPTPIRLEEVLDDVIGIHGPRLKARRISIVRDFAETREITGFPGELRQVFSNLLGNAIEASTSGAGITLRLRRACDWRRMRSGVRVVVSDSGPGISRQNRERIFEPFFTTKGEKGTGLGLWVSNGIVQKHSGSLRFRTSTTPGRSGTCFSVFLPGEDTRNSERVRSSTPDLKAAR